MEAEGRVMRKGERERGKIVYEFTTKQNAWKMGYAVSYGCRNEHYTRGKFYRKGPKCDVLPLS